MNDLVKDIDEVIKSILVRSVELSNLNKALESENAEFRARLSRYEHPEKDSHNSSIPSSRESLRAQSLRRTRSLRPQSDKPSGGQPGHKGTTLQMSEPDKTLFHAPEYCPNCGLSLSEITGVPLEVRQSIDIPLPVCPVITNHVTLSKQCTCGQCNRGSFPSYVKSGVSYGVNIHAVVAYLNTVQHIPFKRLVSALKELYGLEISQGSVANILNRMRKQSKSGYERIRQVIASSPVVGADETGENLNGSLHWMRVFQNELATYIYQDASRGKVAIDKHFPEGLPNSILVTDRHSSYFNMETGGHQICLAHLLRELIYLGELDKEQQWSSNMLTLLRESIHTCKTVPVEEIDVGDIQNRLQVLLEEDLCKLDNKFKALQKSLIKHKDHLLEFLKFPEVPYDNNASERSVRPLKVKQKISGMFKTETGADAFCQLHSIVETARKNRQDPFLALIAVAKNCLKEGAE